MAPTAPALSRSVASGEHAAIRRLTGMRVSGGAKGGLSLAEANAPSERLGVSRRTAGPSHITRRFRPDMGDPPGDIRHPFGRRRPSEHPVSQNEQVHEATSEPRGWRTTCWTVDVIQEYIARLGTPRRRTIALLATFALAGAVLIWAVAAEGSGFRPTAPAALVVALAIVAGALSSPARKIASLMAAAGLAGGAALLAVPAGGHCELPVAEFMAQRRGGRRGSTRTRSLPT